MRRLAILLACGIFALTLAPIGRAQLQTPVQHPEKKKLPDRPVVNPANNNPMPVWIACEGCDLRVLPGKEATVVPREKPVRFMELCYYAMKHQAEDGEYYLLVRLDKEDRVGEYLGWIRKELLVLSPEAKDDPITRIHKKALLINSARSLRQGEYKEIILRSSPRRDSPPRGDALRLYEIQFVYGEADDHLLLGSAPQFEPARGEEDARRVVLGWVPAERVSIWNTREAFSWDWESTYPGTEMRRQTPGRVYKTPEDAIAAAEGKPVQPRFNEVLLTDPRAKQQLARLDPRFERDPLFKSDKGAVSPPLPHNVHRYPILERLGRAGEDDGVKKEGGSIRYDKFHQPGFGSLYKVGCYGGLVDEKGREILNAEELSKLKLKIQRLTDELTNTEILFVIDDTVSMKEWFGEVAAVVQDILTQVKANPQTKVRLAVAYYNDETGNNRQPIVFNPANPRRGAAAGEGEDGLVDILQHGEAIIKELKEHKPHDGGDPREMVFRGIAEGVERARFSSRARKLVIVVGDNGDRGDDNKFTEESIVERLLPDGQSPIDFYAIQVVPPSQDEDARAFQVQVQRIRELYQKRCREADEGAFAGYFPSSSKKEVREQIRQRFERIQEKIEEFRRAEAGFERGGFQSSQITPDFVRELRRENIPVDDLMKVSGLQVYEEGYVWANDGRNGPQMREWLLVNRRELDAVLKMLQGLKQLDPKDRPTVEDLIRLAVEFAAGEEVFQVRLAHAEGDRQRVKENYSPNDLLKATYGLAFRSPLLRKARRTKEPLDYSEYNFLLHKRERLEDVISERTHDYKEEVKDFGGRSVKTWLKSGEARPARHGFKIPGDELRIWYYLDYGKEMP